MAHVSLARDLQAKRVRSKEATMKALVTGGSGFTGVHLVQALVNRGDEVTVLDISAGDSLDIEPLKAQGVKFIAGSVTDAEQLRKAVHGQEVIFHLASAFRDIHQGAPLFQKVDVEGTRRLLDAARSAGTRRVVHCSTQGVHGSLPAGQVPGNEESPFAPIDYYCEAKVAAEAVCERYIAAGMDIVNVRPTSIYGPGDTHGWLKLFRMCKKGRFLMLGSGKVFNHPVYVENLVEGFLRAADVPEARGRTYLLGDDQYVSLNALVRLIGKVLGTKVRLYRFPSYRAVHALAYAMEIASKPFNYEPPLFRRRLTWFSTNRAWDITRARTELGFQPRISLEEGLTLTHKWYYDRKLL
jgi:nucleoside-diphosphate-sugar epimerase